MNVFDDLESEVRGYCRSWPVVFDRAVGSRLYDEFFRTLHDLVLQPRGLDHKVMLPGPAGANAVEAALKLARKVTGREPVVSFTNAFHGMTLGALSVTGNSMKRGGAGIPLVHATPMPYDDYLDGQVPDFLWFERLLADRGSGLDKPAAVIVETVPGWRSSSWSTRRAGSMPRAAASLGDCSSATAARRTRSAARPFDRGLLLETSGPQGDVAKIMTALTITDDELDGGLDILADAVRAIS